MGMACLAGWPGSVTLPPTTYKGAATRGPVSFRGVSGRF